MYNSPSRIGTGLRVRQSSTIARKGAGQARGGVSPRQKVAYPVGEVLGYCMAQQELTIWAKQCTCAGWSPALAQHRPGPMAKLPFSDCRVCSIA